MALFAYKARRGDGTAVRGNREAEGAAALARRLRTEGLVLVEARPSKGRSPRRLRGRSPLSPQELLLFTFNLRTLLEAGLPLLVGFEDLEKQARRPAVRRVFREIAESIAGGSSLADALGRHRETFPAVYRAMVAAGESSGRLPEALDRLHSLLDWRMEVGKQIRNLLAYPIIVLTALLGLAVLALVWVLPRFMGILEMVGGTLPAPTRALLWMSEALRTGWPFLGAIAVGLPVAVVLLRRIRSVRRATDGALLRAPVVGPLVSVSACSQVVHFMSAGIDAGIGLPECLALTAEVGGNEAIRTAVLKVRHQVMSGESLGGAFEAAGIFPPFVRRMVAIGESSGALVETLRRAQIVYDRELPQALRRFSAGLQPMLTAAMGGGLLFLILAILLPLYRVYENLGGAQ